MKKRITAKAWNALDAAIQALYLKAEGSDNYQLDLEDDDDGAELKSAKEREKKRAEKAEKELKAAEKRFLEAEEELDNLRGSKGLDEEGVKKLREKHVADIAAAQKKMDDLLVGLNTSLTEEAAKRIAAEISTVPELMSGEIAKRLKVELVDGLPVVKVTDAAGNVTDNKFEDLTKEFVENEKFAPIIQASRASGGGAAGGQRGGGASKKLSEMSGVEEAKFAKENPVEYNRMIETEQSAQY